MPRIYTSESEPLDFCLRHFPKTEAEAFKKYGKLGDAPDNRGNAFSYNEDHPEYSDTDYTCEICHKELTDKDNYL